MKSPAIWCGIQCFHEIKMNENSILFNLLVLRFATLHTHIVFIKQIEFLNIDHIGIDNLCN